MTTAVECLSCNPAMTCQIRRSDRTPIHELQASKRGYLSVAPMFGTPIVTLLYQIQASRRSRGAPEFYLRLATSRS